MNFTLTQHVHVLDKPGTLQRIGETMRGAGFRKTFLVCDQGMVKFGIAGAIMENITPLLRNLFTR